MTAQPNLANDAWEALLSAQSTLLAVCGCSRLN